MFLISNLIKKDNAWISTFDPIILSGTILFFYPNVRG